MLFCHHHSRAKGFSLIEMMWQLVILVVVSFPMVMALNLQKQSIEKDETQTRNQVLTNSLFAMVNPQDADWYHRYTVTSSGAFRINASNQWEQPPVSDVMRHRPSIYCDKANPSLTLLPFTDPNSPCYENGSTKGDNVKREPFFERDLSVVDNKLRVTVKLFKKPLRSDDSTPYYESSRDFDMTPHRVMMNTLTYPGGEQPPVMDGLGQAWFYDVGYRTSDPLDADLLPDRWSRVRQNVCTASGAVTFPSDVLTPAQQTALTSLPPPFKTFWALNQPEGGRCDNDFSKWLSYRFRVPQGTYNVNLYFLIPAGIDVDKNCLSETANMSCSLVDIALTSGDGLIQTANTYLNFDINAAAGPDFDSNGALHTNVNYPGTSTPKPNKQAIFRAQFTPAGNEMRVFIKPTKPDVNSKSTTVYLSGIEVVRR